ncbi:MAG: 16S rRNA (cytosine(1402)-N(4))-methyltransferase RsmH [Bacteroidales bacterium]|jgi:16S rRNA (cytosine1402-N4)-methyltransferase|nr:16S rRNA (cytosine(1402)-N(4))-methyltransferase RsmH [Bacteroidales bacterium]
MAEYLYHTPVMKRECIEGLAIKPSGVYADVTFGGGGHSREILKHLGPQGRLFVFDQDLDAADNVPQDERIVFFRSNFRYFAQFLRLAGCEKIDGIIADLGVSSHHLDVADRGFSFRFDVPLDMRMNQNAGFDAMELVNTYGAESLKKIFLEYGEIKNAWKLAQNIVSYRGTKKIETVGNLIEAAGNCVPKFNENKYLAQMFQSIRIEVNKEIEVLQEFLLRTAGALKPGGRFVIMTYHSLEDRPVKNYLKTGNFQGKEEKDVYGNLISPFELVNRKVIIPSDEELEKNPRSRSAKLRIAERTVY